MQHSERPKPLMTSPNSHNIEVAGEISKVWRWLQASHGRKLSARPTQRRNSRYTKQMSRVSRFLSQPSSGCNLSTCPSKYFSKNGSKPIVVVAIKHLHYFKTNNHFQTIQHMIVIFWFHHSGLFCRYSTLGYKLNTFVIRRRSSCFQTSRIDGVILEIVKELWDGYIIIYDHSKKKILELLKT